MSRRAPERSGRRSRLKLFLALFLVPAAGAAVIGFYWVRGDLDPTTIRVSPQMRFDLAAAGALILALFLVASLTLPLVHRGVRGARSARARRAAIVRGDIEGSRAGSATLLPLLSGALLLLRPFRLLLVLASFALIAGILVFAARLVEPSFLQPWVDRALDALAVPESLRPPPAV